MTGKTQVLVKGWRETLQGLEGFARYKALNETVEGAEDLVILRKAIRLFHHMIHQLDPYGETE